MTTQPKFRPDPRAEARRDELLAWAHRLECEADDHRRLSCDRSDHSRAVACEDLARAARRMAKR